MKVTTIVVTVLLLAIIVIGNETAAAAAAAAAVTTADPGPSRFIIPGSMPTQQQVVHLPTPQNDEGHEQPPLTTTQQEPNEREAMAVAAMAAQQQQRRQNVISSMEEKRNTSWQLGCPKIDSDTQQFLGDFSFWFDGVTKVMVNCFSERHNGQLWQIVLIHNCHVTSCYLMLTLIFTLLVNCN